MDRPHQKGQDLIQSLGGVVFNLDWEFRNKLIDVLRDASDLFYGDTLNELQRTRLTEQYNDLITVLLNLARKDKIAIRSFNCFDFGYEQRGNLILCLADDCFGVLYFELLDEQLRSELVEKNENQILILSSLKWQELDENELQQPIAVDCVETIINVSEPEKAHEDSESAKEDAKSVKSEKSVKSQKSTKSESGKSEKSTVRSDEKPAKVDRPVVAKSERMPERAPERAAERAAERVARSSPPPRGPRSTRPEKKPDERRKQSTDDLHSQSTEIPISVEHELFPRVKAVDENYLREKLTKIEEALPRLQKIRKTNEFPYYEPIKVETVVGEPKETEEPPKKEKIKNLNEQVSSLSDDIRNLKLQISQLKGGSQSMNNLSYESTTVKKYKVKTTERYLFGFPY